MTWNLTTPGAFDSRSFLIANVWLMSQVENVQMETVWLVQGAQAQGLCWPPFTAILSSKYMRDAPAIAAFPSYGSVAIFSLALIREISAQIRVEAMAGVIT
jgi:hypothetical protein